MMYTHGKSKLRIGAFTQRTLLSKGLIFTMLALLAMPTLFKKKPAKKIRRHYNF
jgi:hypothetical protein